MAPEKKDLQLPLSEKELVFGDIRYAEINVPEFFASIEQRALPPSDSVALNTGIKNYLRDAAKEPRLSADEETILSMIRIAGDMALLKAGKGGTNGDRRGLELKILQGKSAINRFVSSNLLLSFHWAKRKQGRGLELWDLAQAGNEGLRVAARKFDFRKENKFSTYASWWIRQRIDRTINNEGRLIRIPPHVNEALTKIRKFQNQYINDHGVVPSNAEIANSVEIPEISVERYLKAGQEPFSLESLVMRGSDDGTELGELLADPQGIDPEGEYEKHQMNEVAKIIREELRNPREAKIILLRNGLADGKYYSLKEIGQKFGITRERIRQIEWLAVQKLRHPRVVEKLKRLGVL